MEEKQKLNKSRSKTFGIFINPKIETQEIDWKSLKTNEIVEKIKELEFPNKYDLTQTLNSIEFNNVHENSTTREDFEGQLELGSDSRIPHYKL